MEARYLVGCTKNDRFWYTLVVSSIIENKGFWKTQAYSGIQNY